MTPAPKRNKILTSLYLTPEQAKSLDLLSARSRITKAVLLREAVDDLLTKYQWMQQPALGGLPQKPKRKARK